MRNVEGAKAGSSQKKPYRAPVSATSTQKMRIKYGISEGTILGFGRNYTYEDMLKRIFLDGTPIMSAEGEKLLDVLVEFREGSQDQAPISGLPSITVEHDVNVEVKLATPVSRSFTRKDTTSFDVRISIPTLYEGNEDGDSNAGLVQFKIDIATDGGSFVEAGRFEIREKILNGYSSTYNVEVTKGSNHIVRVSRLNSEVVSDFSVNKLLVDAIIEVTDVRLRYSNTAILYLEYDAEQFNNVPKLEMRVFGKNDILVPANYDSDTRIYAASGAGTTNGVWDGTWKRDYTDNPVWIALDLLLARRYGLGDKIDLTMINKWELYGLAQYCDESVPDGKGGTEPRFTCNNMYLQKSEDAYRVLKDLAASFRAKVVWDGEFITLLADTPRDPVFTFSNANAKDITYSSTQDSAQRNLINVQYYDRDNKFSSDVVMQRSTSNVLARGKVVDGNFTALGCTSQGQAQRIASYVMNSELYETELVSFTTGLDGGLVRLNDVIMLADNSVAGQTVGGRLAAVDGRFVTLDRPIPHNVQAIPTTQLVINQTDGKTTPTSVISISSDRLVAELANDPPAGTEAGLVWALLTKDLVPQKFTVTDIEFNDADMTFAISAIQYNESKYAAIDGSARIVVPPISIVDYAMLRAPIQVIASYLTRIVQDASVCDIDVSWSQSTNAVQYQLEMQKEGGPWRIIGRMQALAYTLDNMYTGLYTFRVCAYDGLGNASPYTYSDPILVAGKVLPPPLLSTYSVTGILFGYQHSWVYPAHTEDSRSVRLRFTTVDPATSPNQQWQYLDVAYPTTTFTEQDVSIGLRTWFSAAIVDKYGNTGEYTTWQSAIPKTDPVQILDLLDGQISGSQLDQDLLADIAAGSGALTQATAAGIAASNAANAVSQETAARVAAIQGLNDGLTTETTQRKDGDTANLQAINTYKTSNDAALAAVRTETQTNTSTNTSQATQLSQLTSSVTGLQNSKADASALTALDTKVTQQGNTQTSQATQLTNLTATANSAISAVTVTDTRNTDEPPSWYWANHAKRVVNEFKAAATIGVTGLGTYVNLETRVYYNDASGGAIIQYARAALDSTLTLERNSTGSGAASTWVAWRQPLKVMKDDIATRATAAALSLTDAKVVIIDGVTTAHTTQLTNLSASITTLQNTKADASALTNYYTKAQADTATAGQVSTYNASLKVGGTNLWVLSDLMAAYIYNGTTGADTASHQARITLIPTSGTTLIYQLWNPDKITNAADTTCVAFYTAAQVFISEVALPNLNATAYQTLTIPVPANAALVRLGAIVGTAGSATVNPRIKVQFEWATKPSEWSPAPEDVQGDISQNANALSSLSVTVGTLNGQVTAQATQMTNLSTTVGNNTASITSQQTTIDGISAKATLQVAAGNTVGGIALGNNAGVVDMIIRADKFAIAPPVAAGAGDTGKYAFQYRATSTTLSNGTVVPAGLYLDNASIGFIDAAKINATSLSAISANLGTFTTIAADGSKTVISGGKTEVFYANGVLAYRAGVW